MLNVIIVSDVTPSRQLYAKIFILVPRSWFIEPYQVVSDDTQNNNKERETQHNTAQLIVLLD
jgi:hypothetical protein